MFDFQKLYAIYPRKEGKVNGMRACHKHIKSIEDYLRFERAVLNYVDLCRTEKREKRFILLWQTFANGRWEDYVDIDLHPTTGNGNASLAERIIRGEV